MTPRRWMAATVVSAVVAISSTAVVVVRVLDRPGGRAGDGLSSLTDPSPAASSAPSSSRMPSVRATAHPAAPDADTRTAARPTTLRIPALDVEADVRAVGVERDGAMTIPAAPTTVGWYRFGAAPSDPSGHTVIAGHIATREDGAGALAPLAGARPGMAVELVDSAGVTHRYVVRGRESVHKKALPVDRIFARDGRPLLVLITCGGEYIEKLRSHRDNLIVTAVPVS